MPSNEEILVTKISILMNKKLPLLPQFRNKIIVPEDAIAQKSLFDMYDKNRDGRLSSSELNVLLADAGIGNTMTRGMWVKGIIGNMDRPAPITGQLDGQISWPEYLAAIKQALHGGPMPVSQQERALPLNYHFGNTWPQRGRSWHGH
jgi:hypothetical protein